MDKHETSPENAQPPTYSSLYSPYYGLQKLASLDRIVVRQRKSIRNRYQVTSEDGEVIFNAREVTSLLRGQYRDFQIDIYDQRGQQVISLQRCNGMRDQTMEVLLGGQVVAIVRPKLSLKPVLEITDDLGQLVMRVKGPRSWEKSYTFTVLDTSQVAIGSITKKWKGLAKEVFSDSIKFPIQFPLDLDVRFKAALIGTCILINIRYYSGVI